MQQEQLLAYDLGTSGVKASIIAADGTVVGTQTVGKANYQQTFVLSDGSAVAVSTGHYQTPHGVTLAGVGITPDIPVEVDDDTYLKIYSNALEKSEDTQLQAAIAALTQGNP